MPAITVLRGFKVSVSTLDAFLVANKARATDGDPVHYPHHIDQVFNLLFTKMGNSGDNNNYRIIIPQRVGYSPADTAYITYSLFMVYAQRELRDSDLPSEAPSAFESLRREVLSFSNTPNDDTDGQMGLYVVFTEEENFKPEFIRQRNSIVSANATTNHLYSASNQALTFCVEGYQMRLL